MFLFFSRLMMSFLMFGGPVALAQATVDGSDLKRPQTPASEYVSQEMLNLFRKYGRETSLASAAAVSAAQSNGEELRERIIELDRVVRRVSESLRQQAEELAAQRAMIRDVIELVRTQQTTIKNITEQLYSEIRKESQKTRLEISVALNYSREACIDASRIAFINTGQRQQSTRDQGEEQWQLLNETRNCCRQANVPDERKNDSDVVLNNLITEFRSQLRRYINALVDNVNGSDRSRESVLQTEVSVFQNLSSHLRRSDDICDDYRSQMENVLVRATHSLNFILSQRDRANFWTEAVSWFSVINELRQSFINNINHIRNQHSSILNDVDRQFQRIVNVVSAAGAGPGHIRLANGNSSRSGRVELRLGPEGNSWGTVCDDHFDDIDAAVVCYSLGYGRIGRTLGNAYYGPGSGNILLDDLACNGTESTLLQCPHRGLGVHNCGHNEDVSVSCGSS